MGEPRHRSCLLLCMVPLESPGFGKEEYINKFWCSIPMYDDNIGMCGKIEMKRSDVRY